MSQSAFKTLNLQAALLDNIETLGYQCMTPVQAQSLPHILQGRDVIAQAKTGSGKTAAFALGLLEKLQVKQFRIQTLILCPTRELADQVAKEVRRIGRGIHNIKVLTLCGGKPFGPQISSLEHGAHIIVGTPGRIEEHCRKGTLKLEHVDTLVLDEADRMLEMGFQPALDTIIEFIPKQRQSLLFSATFPEQIQAISKRYLRNPEMVKIESKHDDDSIQQRLYRLDNNIDRITAIRLILMQFTPESTLIFCNTKLKTQELADELNHFGFSALALHGDLDQKDRDQTLVRFANKSISILVATDVAARGLDIDSLNVVINYQLSHDTEVHIHRIGRTGRAGSKGIACTLYSEKETYRLQRLEEYLGYNLELKTLPPMKFLDKPIQPPSMVTLCIESGKKQKIRPGDILGALTAGKGITSKHVGKIQIFDYKAFVAVSQKIANDALKKLNQGKLKGRSIKVRRIRG